jgi:hypothetical protein
MEQYRLEAPASASMPIAKARTHTSQAAVNRSNWAIYVLPASEGSSCTLALYEVTGDQPIL